MLITQCIVVTIKSHYAGFAILAIAVLIGVFHEFYLRTSQRLRLLEVESRSPVLSVLLEYLDGRTRIRLGSVVLAERNRGLGKIATAVPPPSNSSGHSENLEDSDGED